ncbi:MAG: hypothetical protein D6798_10460 [Deltaproteobacteria bacterium]|nr:MAG: hypothetical protein D6798_10460 [Deltaproteobacteria bacterium]
MNPGDALCWWLTALARQRLLDGLPPITIDQVDGDAMLAEAPNGAPVALPRPPGLPLREGDRLAFGFSWMPRSRPGEARDATPRPASPTPVDLPLEIDLTVDRLSSTGPGVPPRPPPARGAPAAGSSLASSTPSSPRTSP